ncbi:MAG: hypothetical protein U0793_00860 [Gemmataceae bacterium]
MSHLPALLLWTFAAGGDAKLEITDVRTTLGYMGATRDKTPRLPGDTIHFAFNVRNLALNKEGQADFSMLLEVLDPKGDVIYSQGPRNHLVQNFFGGNLVPCHALMNLPNDAEPGEYTARVTITDKNGGGKVSFSGKGKVLAPDFGIFRVGTFGEFGSPRAPVGTVGELLQVRFSVTRFEQNKAGDCDLDVSLKILDDKGEPLKVKTHSHHIKTAPKSVEKALPLQFGLTLDRPGQFTLLISARDNKQGKTSEMRIPLRVLAPE